MKKVEVFYYFLHMDDCTFFVANCIGIIKTELHKVVSQLHNVLKDTFPKSLIQTNKRINLTSPVNELPKKK